MSTKKTPKTKAPKTAKAKKPPQVTAAPADPVLPLTTESPPGLEPTPATEATPAAEPIPAREPTPLTEPTAGPAQTKAHAQRKGKPKAAPKAKQLSALDAAVKVLDETGQAMTCPELIAAMAAQGYWTSPNGQTPAATLYAAILRELQTKGANARFTKTERGKFALNGAA